MKKIKLIKTAILMTSLTAVGGLTGCGESIHGDNSISIFEMTAKKGDMYRYSYTNADQEYVMGSDNGSTKLSGLKGTINLADKRAYIINVLAGGMLYHSGGGNYEINNDELIISLDKSFKFSNAATVLGNISADKNNIYIPIDMCYDVKRAFRKTK